ncbi:helicase-related protein [Verrucomicrobium sp. BvORR034]|uniref:DEAD/DEAH box helicase n=1 Tax=Verrucomicrobium sp. BvORR034 TaxID=1396418 RepID=UPI002240EA0E|nr:helicase-related protein [Verrucomicrobium sp. BvORR034]
MPVKPSSQLSLRDTLSHLDHIAAAKLLGTGGRELLIKGGSVTIEVTEQVHFTEDHFQVVFPHPEKEPLVVTLSLHPGARRRLQIACSHDGDEADFYKAATFALILEEKTLLGLAAAPPDLDIPWELLPAHQLEARALAERTKRAAEEKMRIKTADKAQPWTDYTVTNPVSGKSYRVGLRGLGRGQSYCACPDFRRNRLGTCKHVIAVHTWVGKKFDSRTLKRAWKPKSINIHALYDGDLRLAVEHPSNLAPSVAELLAPWENRQAKSTQDMLALFELIRQLIQLDQNPVIYPDAEEILSRSLHEHRLAGLVEEIRKAPAKHPLRTTLLKTGLLPYQLDGIAFAAGKGRAVLADEMGLGKTIQGVGVAEFLARHADVRRVLVVCPASLKSQWKLEIERFCGRSVQIVSGKTSERNALYSGVFSVVEFVDDRRLGPAYRFFHSHRVATETGRVSGYKNLDALRQQLEPVLLRRTRASIALDLPPRTTEIVRIPATEEQQHLHNSHMVTVNAITSKKFLSEMDLLRLQKALLMARMSANSTYLVDKQSPGFSSKLDRLSELLEALSGEPERKIILFTEWTTMLNLIEPLLQKLKMDFVRLDGQVAQKKRQSLVSEFQSNPKCRVFLTTNAGSTGLNLQAADTVINVDLPWNPALLEQRIARAHRMGQKRKVQVHLLVTEGTIEENLLATLGAKHELAAAVLDPDSTLQEVTLSSGIEELRRRLEILLGAKVEADLDVSSQNQAEVAAGISEGTTPPDAERKARVAEATGTLVASAFSLLGELLPSGKVSPPAESVNAIQAALLENVVLGEDGQPTLTLKLPNQESVNAMASALARLMSLGSGVGS